MKWAKLVGLLVTPLFIPAPFSTTGDQIWHRCSSIYLMFPIYNMGNIIPAYFPWWFLHDTELSIHSVVLHIFFFKETLKTKISILLRDQDVRIAYGFIG